MAAKTEVFQIRLSEDEKTTIKKKAESVGLPMSRYLVMLALKDNPENEKAARSL